MGTVIGGLLGTSGGANGTGFTAPERFNPETVTTPGQVQQGQAGVTNSLASQQALLAALQGQGAIGYQSQAGAQQKTLADQLNQTNAVGTQNAALNQQANFNQQLATANGIGTQNAAVSGLQNVAAQQQGTAGLYQNIAEGRGPNPAQAMLNQQTGQNVANQAALMAGQRGAGANIGLLARQAAMQGASAQQQAIGQGASLQAQQQINALSGLTGAQQAQAQTQQAIGGLGTQQAGMQQAGIMNQAQQAQAQMAAQAAANQAVVNQTNLLAQQHIGAQQAAVQGNLANAGQLQGALGNMNSANVSAQGDVNKSNAALATKQMEGQQGFVGGILNAAGPAAGMGGGGAGAAAAPAAAAALAGGGMIKKMAVGGDPGISPAVSAQPASGPVSPYGQFLSNWGAGMKVTPPKDENGQQENFGMGSKELNKGTANFGRGLISAFNQPSSPPPGEYAGTDATNLGSVPMTAAEGGLAESGGPVVAKNASQKAEKSGNSYANDKIPALVSENEIVIPRSITMGEDPVNESAKFVADTLAKRKSPQKMKEGGEVTQDLPQPAPSTPIEPEPEEAAAQEQVPEPASTPPSEPAAAPTLAPEAEAVPAAEPVAEAPAAAATKPQNAPQQAAPAAEESKTAAPEPVPTAQDLDAQAAKLHQDFAMGHIQPKTYKDLYADKSTLGKLGTLFGLLISGAGAGLTHQKNALLDMMDKTIERDLEAQKHSQVNAQNWLRLAQEHEVQKATVQQAGAHTALLKGQAALLPVEAREKEASIKNLNQDTALKSLNTTKTAMLLSTLQDFTNHVNTMPPGPNKDNAQNALQNEIQPAVVEKIGQDNAKTAAALKLSAAQQQQQQAQDSGVDIGKFNKLVNLGRAEQAGLGNTLKGMNEHDVSEANKEAAKVQDNRAIAKIYSDSFNRLDQAFAAGRLNKNLRDAEIATLGAAVARATAGRFNAAEAASQANGMFPSALDYGAARGEKFRKAMQYFKSEEAGTPTLDRFALKTKFPDYKIVSSSKGSGNSSPVERSTPDGKVALFDPGTKKFLGYKNEKSSVAARGK